jgi:hypothetical protein
MTVTWLTVQENLNTDLDEPNGRGGTPRRRHLRPRRDTAASIVALGAAAGLAEADLASGFGSTPSRITGLRGHDLLAATPV